MVLSSVRVAASACNTDTTQTQPHQISNTQRTKNKTTDVVIQQHSRMLLMMDTLMSETCWVHKKWNRITSDIKLVFYSSTNKNQVHRTVCLCTCVGAFAFFFNSVMLLHMLHLWSAISWKQSRDWLWAAMEVKISRNLLLVSQDVRFVLFEQWSRKRLRKIYGFLTMVCYLLIYFLTYMLACLFTYFLRGAELFLSS